MSIYKESAAPGKHHNDGPPRLNSSRCGMNHIHANALNQSSSGAVHAVTKKPDGGRTMNQELVERREQEFAVIDQVVMRGDLSKLTSEQRVMYYHKVCESVGLNPMTNPFSYLDMKGKLVLYANKDCSEQLRKINGVSIEGLDGKIIDDIYLVTAKAKDKNGRIDQATGAVVVGNLRGEAKANAIMKAETKAKRRVTLSICGMGWTDESEVESIPNAVPVNVDLSTGEIKGHVQVLVEAQTEAPSVADNGPRLSIDQVYEIEVILDECDDKYRRWVYDYVQRTFKSNDLTGVRADMYDRMKAAAIKNMEMNHERQRKECPEALEAVPV